jgi:hypothetical protein
MTVLKGVQALSGYPACLLIRDCKYRYSKNAGYGKNNLMTKEKRGKF